MKRFLLILLLFILLIGIFIGIDVFNKIRKPYRGYDKEIRIHVAKGSSVKSIAHLLHKNGVIANKTYFVLYYRLFFNKLTFQSGEYLFNTPLTMKQIIEKLNKGKVILYKITVKEGLTIKETARLLEANHKINAQDFIKACQNTDLIKSIDDKAEDLEGYIFPETYLVPRNTTAAELVEMMVKRFRSKFSQSFHWRARDINKSIRQVVILASLIEKETAAREERFLISSVFHNRLRIGMPLACDPTIIYALKRENKYRDKLGWKDLKFDSPYNTRIYKNLPPGPICSPGFDSIEAALYPANTSYLYFVAKNDKYHHFSKTLKEHNWAVRKYIINKGK
jgi:UPF0755 protein